MLEIFRSLFAPPRDLILPLLAAWLGLLTAERHAIRHQLTRDAVNNLIFYGMLAFVGSGRIFHALSHLPAYMASPWSLFSPNPDLFDQWGAIAGAALTGFLLARRQKLPILRTLDALTPFFAVLAVGVTLMHLAAGTAFGQPAGVPWAMELWGALRHPSQIYELMAALSILGLVLLPGSQMRPGFLFLTYAALAAGTRLFLEAFRGDSSLLPGGFRQAQVIAWLVLAGAFMLMEMILTGRNANDRPDHSE